MVAAGAAGAGARFPPPGAYLKLLAAARLTTTPAQDAAAGGEAERASDALDGADAALAALRAAWPGMTAAERSLVGRAAAPLSARVERTRARLPRRLALSEGTPERDPDEDVDPEARAA